MWSFDIFCCRDLIFGTVTDYQKSTIPIVHWRMIGQNARHQETHSLPIRLCSVTYLCSFSDVSHSIDISGASPAVDTLYRSGNVNGMMESDAEKFSDISLLHELHNRESLTTYASDDAVSGACTTMSESEEPNQIPVKLKLCIEKEYIHEIVVDHSMLAEELEKRMMTLAELEKCCLAALETATVHKQECLKGFGAKSGVSSASATPKAPRTPGSIARSARLRLTGESIRKLVKMISPATRRRHHSSENHSSGSSLSGNTPTGSARSISGACDFEFSSVVISDTNASS